MKILLKIILLTILTYLAYRFGLKNLWIGIASLASIIVTWVLLFSPKKIRI